MMDVIIRRLANLLNVKTIVTLTLTAIFSFLSVRGIISGEQFLTVFTVVVAFYFGTQKEKADREDRHG